MMWNRLLNIYYQTANVLTLVGEGPVCSGWWQCRDSWLIKVLRMTVECLFLNGMFPFPRTFRNKVEERVERIQEEPDVREEGCGMLSSGYDMALHPSIHRSFWISAWYLHKAGAINVSLWIGEWLITSHSPWATAGNKWSVTTSFK